MISPIPVDITRYDLILVNSSGGKDSAVTALYITQLAREAGILDRVLIAHATFYEEWPGTVELVRQQAKQLGISRVEVVRRQNEDLLDYVRRRGKWPSAQQRYCTSEFKRAPIDKVITRLGTGRYRQRVLNIMGIRRQESDARAKKPPFHWDARRSNSKRDVDQWYPIFDLTEAQVWEVIREHNLPMHPAYAAGIPRLSCRFCIFAPKPVLVAAGRMNPELLKEYVRVEEQIGHQFTQKFSIASILKAVESGEEVGPLTSWSM
jgi:3'-phosphoadenosine 5'-phosphosulfate sulfotransferase (PAPS reductase)/FAD synthetase